MKKYHISWLSILITILIFTACSKPKTPKIEQIETNQDNKTVLFIKDKKIEVEVVKTPEERTFGLMFRQTLPENAGMLFIFEDKGIYSFWMKNTQIPLSIAFIDEKSVIIDILEMVPNQEAIHYAPAEPFLYALEMNQGWFLRNRINIGDTVYGIQK